MTRLRTLLSAATISASWLVGVSAQAKPPEVRECLAAHESAVTLRRTGKLRDARKSFVTCASESCPADIRKECSERLADVDDSVPTIVLDAGAAPPKGVRVSSDGEVVADRLDGLAIPIDPGSHVLRIECIGGRTYEERMFVAEGDKRRRVVLACDAPSETPASAPAAAATPPATSSAVVPVAAYVLGGVAVLGVAGFGTFAILGRSKESDLEEKCSPRCTKNEVAPARTQYLIADVSLAVGVVAAASAVAVVIWSRKDAAGAIARVSAGSFNGGAGITAEGRF